MHYIGLRGTGKFEGDRRISIYYMLFNTHTYIFSGNTARTMSTGSPKAKKKKAKAEQRPGCAGWKREPQGV